MTRTLIEIPENLIAKLDNYAKAVHLSRSALIRQAIVLWLQNQASNTTKDAFGILKGKMPDGVKYQRKVREDW